MWYADSTLKSMKKDNLIGIIRCLEHNISVADERNRNQFRILMKHEKYHWHDLRKDPEDLPKLDKQVIIAFGNPVGYKAVFYERDLHDGTVWSDRCCYYNGVIAWRYIEPFEEVEGRKYDKCD